MSYVLVRFEDNWADEMDVEGFGIWTDEKHQRLINDPKLDTCFPFEAYFGTNESNEYQSKEEFLRCFKFSPLSDDEAIMFKKFFPYGFGHLPWPE